MVSPRGRGEGSWVGVGEQAFEEEGREEADPQTDREVALADDRNKRLVALSKLVRGNGKRADKG